MWHLSLLNWYQIKYLINKLIKRNDFRDLNLFVLLSRFVLYVIQFLKKWMCSHRSEPFHSFSSWPIKPTCLYAVYIMLFIFITGNTMTHYCRHPDTSLLGNRPGSTMYPSNSMDDITSYTEDPSETPSRMHPKPMVFVWYPRFTLRMNIHRCYPGYLNSYIHILH